MAAKGDESMTIEERLVELEEFRDRIEVALKKLLQMMEGMK